MAYSSQPEFHPITSSRFLLSVTEGVITTRSDRIKFRQEPIFFFDQLHATERKKGRKNFRSVVSKKNVACMLRSKSFSWRESEQKRK